MISSLEGKITYKGPDWVEINVGGIGWQVFLPPSKLSRFTIDKEAKIFTYQRVAENIQELYGFITRKDKKVFELLISVSGIGPRTAMGIFSIGSGERILRAVAQADVEFFRQVKGLGNKGSQRIIVDLKSKVGSVKDLDLETGEGGNQLVYQALESLGFKKQEARSALKKLPGNIESDNEKIKFALKELGKQ